MHDRRTFSFARIPCVIALQDIRPLVAIGVYALIGVYPVWFKVFYGSRAT